MTLATGGDNVYDIDVSGTPYRVHEFTTVGTSTLTVLSGGQVEYLIVAGGGSGAGSVGGGGGAGGLLSGSTTVTSGIVGVVVGAGGSSAASAGNSGGASEFGSITTVGGGGGSSFNAVPLGGGSGGGAGGRNSGTQAGGAGTTGQGNNGGSSTFIVSFNRPSGGGGGAGAAGANSASLQSGNGGNGIESSITGTPTFYAGGGGGGADRNLSMLGGAGGLGGGGAGGNGSTSPINGANGTDGLGGGGGGGNAPTVGSGNGLGGAGGDGIVIIRYTLPGPLTTVVTVDGVDYTSETIDTVQIVRGRDTVYQDPSASYARVQLLDFDGTGLPIDITKTLTVQVRKTDLSLLTVFSGYVTDVSADIYDPGIGPQAAAARYTLLAVGPLAKLSRRTVLTAGRPAETDSARVGAAIEEGLAITWEEWPDGTWDDLDVALTWETVDPLYDPALIDSSVFDLAALPASPSGYSALEVATQASNSAEGLLYETLDGKVGWDNADARGLVTTFIEIPPDVIGAAGLRTSSTVSDLANRVTVEWDSGAETSQDSTSIVDYGLYTRRISTTLADGTNASDRADMYVERHAYPTIQLDSISVRLDTLTDDTLIDALLEVRSGTGVDLLELPATLGIVQLLGFIEGVHLTLDRYRTEVRLAISDAALSFSSVRWSGVDALTTWDDVSGTLAWEDARSV